MNKAFDITSIRLTLRQMIAKGYITLEDLDTPPPGYKMLVEEMSRHRCVELRRFKVPEYRNPLRDPDQPEAVERFDARDFTPTQGKTPAHSPALPLTLDEEEPI